MSLKPCGHYVLVEDEVFESVSKGGIIVASMTEAEREQKGIEFGRIIEFGPLAFKDVKGCRAPEDWGVKVGDLVEYSGRYDGKLSAWCRENRVEGKRLRLIPDLSIVSRLEE